MIYPYNGLPIVLAAGANIRGEFFDLSLPGPLGPVRRNHHPFPGEGIVPVMEMFIEV